MNKRSAVNTLKKSTTKATLLWYTCMATLLLMACEQRSSPPPVQKTSPEAPELTVKSKEYTPPAIPVVIRVEQQRTDFMAVHYWDNFPMADTTLIEEKEVIEQAVANYIYLLSMTTPDLQRKGLGILLDNALAGSKQMFSHFVEQLEHYLYEPNSPTRCEEQYIMVLKHIMAMTPLEDIDKYRPRYQLKMALKNRPNDKATDFSYTLRSDEKGTLLTLQSEYTLLYLFNPDCHACDEITEALKREPRVVRMLADKRLTILAIYPDEDMNLWEKGKNKLPKEWLVGYDSPRTILPNELYDLRATPTMLLLDRDKRVLLKDVRIDELGNYMQNIV